MDSWYSICRIGSHPMMRLMLARLLIKILALVPGLYSYWLRVRRRSRRSPLLGMGIKLELNLMNTFTIRNCISIQRKWVPNSTLVSLVTKKSACYKNPSIIQYGVFYTQMRTCVLRLWETQSWLMNLFSLNIVLLRITSHLIRLTIEMILAWSMKYVYTLIVLKIRVKL